MRPFKRLLSRQEALEIITSNIQPIEKRESIPLQDAAQRVLSKDVVADFNVPPFDRSSMDGYAVRAEDTYGASTFNPRKLKLVGVQHAGDWFQGEVNQGECLQIATGSPIPPGSNAVVMVEYTKLDGDSVQVLQAVYPGANISPEGEDIIKGDVVVKKGEILTAPKIGAIAALGVENIEAYVKPVVTVVSTGSEVRPLNNPLEPGQIYDINSYTLSTIIRSNGCLPHRTGIVPDDLEAIQSALKNAASRDIVVFSGGSSVGSRDLLYEVVHSCGEVIFHGVQVKPGKPTLFGLVEETPVFGMPGYPTSCLSNAYLFLLPALRKKARLPPYKPKLVKAKMATQVVSTSGREQYLTVRLEGDIAHPVFKKSGAITSMAYAHGYVILPINTDTLQEGEEVYVTLLE